MSRPEPRPALQRSGDGGVHPAAPRVATEKHIHPAPHAPAASAKASKKRKGGKTIDRADDSVTIAKDTSVDEELPTFTGKPVTLSVTVPKDLRKQVRKLAEKRDTSVDDVVVDALRRHVAKPG